MIAWVFIILLLLWNMWQETQITRLGQHVNLLVDRVNVQTEMIRVLAEK